MDIFRTSCVCVGGGGGGAGCDTVYVPLSPFGSAVTTNWNNNNKITKYFTVFVGIAEIFSDILQIFNLVFFHETEYEFFIVE